MQAISVVIVCKNEAGVIGGTLTSLQGITDDIIVFDNGSTDDTIDIATALGARVHKGAWEGFGKTKTRANCLAKYDWILSLDADEHVDDELKKSLLHFNPAGSHEAFSLRFKNFLGSKEIRHGEWGNDSHVRLFNRTAVTWNDEAVHETLMLPMGMKMRSLEGAILHRTVKDINQYSRKTVHYAMLSADKYFKEGKKASWFKMRLSPGFNFINYYFFKLGFLDGHEGYVCAKMTAHYTFLKYSRLRELWRNSLPVKDRHKS